MSKLVHSTEVIDTLQQAVDEMRACTDNGYILAWDYGMGVAFTEGQGRDCKPYACGLHMAHVVANDDMPEEAWAYVPIVTNGHGVRATLTRRQKAMAAEIAKLEKIITEYGQ